MIIKLYNKQSVFALVYYGCLSLRTGSLWTLFQFKEPVRRLWLPLHEPGLICNSDWKTAWGLFSCEGRFPQGGILRAERNFSLSFLISPPEKSQDKETFRSALKIPPSGKRPWGWLQHCAFVFNAVGGGGRWRVVGGLWGGGGILNPSRQNMDLDRKKQIYIYTWVTPIKN